jgi:hypothetical protein
MPTNNQGFLSTQELDFNAYREQIKQFLSQQDQFKDYDFEGSNLKVLIDLLAYNTYMNGAYLNMVGSEMFLDTALQRESIVSHAKEINYTPRSKASASVLVDIEVSGNNKPAVMTIPKNYRVSGRAANGAIYSFVTAEAINIGAANDYIAQEVAIYEGRIVNETFIANSSQQYILASANVDTTSIEVVVQTSNTDTSNSQWMRATTLFGHSADSEVFFVEGYEDYNYRLVFGNDVVGKALTPGNVVRVSYRNTLGEAGNGIKRFVGEQSIEGFSDVTVTVSEANTASAGGSDHETNSEIKFNAPRYFATQERAITASDFVILLQNQFPTLEAITAYGGENAEPKQYGRVIVSAKPRGATLMSNALKDQILKFLRGKTSLAIDPIIVDPDFFSVSIVSEITYDLNSTIKTPTELMTVVNQAILDYSEESLSQFGSDLRYSKLLRAIDDSDTSIVSNETTVQMTKKLYPTVGRSQSYSFSFGNQLANTNTGAVVTSSTFVYTLGGTDYTSHISDNGLGVLHIYTMDQSGNEISLGTIGTIDYATGAVTMSGLSVTSLVSSNSLKIHARLLLKDIETNNNKILLIEGEDITLSTNGIRV